MTRLVKVCEDTLLSYIYGWILIGCINHVARFYGLLIGRQRSEHAQPRFISETQLFYSRYLENRAVEC